MHLERGKYIFAVSVYGTVGLLLHYVSLPSEVAVLCRGSIGALSVLTFLLARGQKLHFARVRANLPVLLLSGALLGLNWVFLFAAYRVTTVAVASVCTYTAPVIVLAVSPLLFHERLTAKKLACIALAFAGVLLVSGVFGDGRGGVNLPGLGLGMASALSFVGVLLCNKRKMDLDPLEKTVVELAVSALVVLPYVLYRQHGQALSLDVCSGVLLLVLGVFHTGFAYVLYFGSMAKLPVHSVAILGYLEPVVSVLTSTLVLREPITAWGILGAALILGAAVYSELPDTPQQKSPPRRRAAGGKV